MTPVQASEKSIEKIDVSNLQYRRQKQKPKFKFGILIRTSDTRSVFSIGDSPNYSYEVYTNTEVIQDTIPLYRINFLPERYNHNLL